jgi:hypothetical protein
MTNNSPEKPAQKQMRYTVEQFKAALEGSIRECGYINDWSMLCIVLQRLFPDQEESFTRADISAFIHYASERLPNDKPKEQQEPIKKALLLLADEAKRVRIGGSNE